MYAKSGLRVFPLWRGKKIPMTPSGWKDSSSDPEIVTAWWSGRPDSGIGIEIPKDIVVVDTDGEEGRQVLLDLKMLLPHTLEALSGRAGGEHYWYRLKTTKTEVGRKINVFPKVDVLVNGFVVAPPSVHENGRRYHWRSGFDMNQIVEAPDWIYQLYEDHEKFSSKLEPTELLHGVPDGQRQVTLFRYACKLRNTAGLTLEEAKILVQKVADASGYDEQSIPKLVERVWKKYPAPENHQEEIKIWSMAELKAANLPAPKYLIHESVKGGKRGLLRGVGLLTAEPKRGKSVLAKYIAKCVATGQKVWNKFDVESCGVLYIDYEETPESAKENWEILFKDEEWSGNLFTAYDWPRADKGGLDKIKRVLDENNSIGLVVIDTLGYFWNQDNSSGHTVYHQEQRFMQPFNKIYSDYGVTFLLIHHNRKGQDGETGMKKASGSYALTGSSHTIWNLEREDNSPIGILSITGKGKLFERELNLLFKPPYWELQDE